MLVIILLVGVLFLKLNNKGNIEQYGNNNTNNPASNNETTNQNELEDVQNNIGSSISENDKIKLFNSLLTPSEEYGLYFTKDVTIEKIDDSDLLKYALEKYVVDNKMKMDNTIDCFIGNGSCVEEEVAKYESASKTQVDNYISKLFNTTRQFNSESGSINGYTTGMYAYDSAKKTYYFGQKASSGGWGEYNHKLVKAEEDSNNVYVYTKFFYKSCAEAYCDSKTGKLMYLNFPTNEIPLDKAFYLGNKDDNFIFENYSDKMNTYKHTFKKTNGNYYWRSSEIVK